MKLPDGHAGRLFLGFTCSIMFLVVLAFLIANNTEAESYSLATSMAEEYPLTIGIPTANPETTISFYKKLGFKLTEGLVGGLDMVCMEKDGAPYKLEICHNRSADGVPYTFAVSGMSLRVRDLHKSINELKSKGLSFAETNGKRDGVSYASLIDPNGINIKLFEP
jgi:hypothetical protein